VQEKHLTKQQPYQCPKCDFKNGKVSVLVSHYQSHTASLVCELCSHVAPTLTLLKQHRKRKHATPARHTCAICLKVFAHPTTLVQHQAVHTTEKKFKCMQCTFSTKYRYRTVLYNLILLK
jgi:hypothetical protein